MFYKQHAGKKCPICGRRDCLQYICDYTRTVIHIENGKTYTYYFDDYRIARYLCTNRHRNKKNGRTVSLLPAGIIPYKKHSLEVRAFVLIEFFGRKKRADDIYEMIQIENQPARYDIDISAVLVEHFTKDMIISINKYRIVYPEVKFEGKLSAQIVKFIDYINKYKRETICSPPGCAYDFYSRQGGFEKDAVWLFGIPYQYRQRNKIQ